MIQSAYLCAREKLSPLHSSKKHPEFLPAFHALGSCVDIDDSVFEELEKFTCLTYGSKSGNITLYDTISSLGDSMQSQESN